MSTRMALMIVVTLGLPFATPAAFAASGNAESCDIIVYTNGCSGTFGHIVSNGSGWMGGVDHGSTCYICYCSGQACWGSDCHQCGFQDGDENEEEATAYRELLNAAADHDVDLLLKLAPKVPSRVVVNLERSSLQITSCDRKRLIANIALPSAVVMPLASRLHSVNMSGDDLLQ